MKLEEESKKLVVINTHKGLFQYNRLPFGVSSAPAVFQQTMEEMLSGVPEFGVYLDDIIVTGPTEVAHLQNLRQVHASLTIRAVTGTGNPPSPSPEFHFVPVPEIPRPRNLNLSPSPKFPVPGIPNAPSPLQP
uniref:Reverse transcriptase domain-containing protein n=1 Tax=Plectus sambesii TaxID=2011161 RepID=A0A914XGH9_9BILA